MTLKARYIATFFIILSELILLAESLGYQPHLQYSFHSIPEIRLSKWISTSAAANIDFSYEDDGSEWNSEIDTSSIQISGFGSHEYTISPHVAAIHVECRAQYPVEWEFHNALYVTEDLHGIQMKMFRQSKDVTNPEGDTFVARLEIRMESNKATGNYTCRGANTQTRHLSNNIFIFWEGSSPPYLALSGKLFELELDTSSTGPRSVTIPCYVSNPTVSVLLFKEYTGEFKELSQSMKLSYEFSPKIGFRMKYQNASDVLGTYRCYSGERDDNDLMEVRIKPSIVRSDSCQEDGSCFRRKLSPGTRFYFDDTSEELICCGRKGSPKPTRLHFLLCQNPSSCGMYEPFMYMTSGSNGKRSKNDSCVRERLYPQDFGIARCKGDGIDVFTYVYTEYWTPEQEHLRAVFDWRELNPQNMVHLMIHASFPMYDRQLVTATCQTLHSYFSDGIKWAIKWKNGSQYYFDSILSGERDPRLHGKRSTYIKLDIMMAELSCFAPVWNSTNWVEKRISLDIKTSRSPKIAGATIEEKTFGLNETDKILECSSDGEPPAKIRWTKNDEEVARSTVIWNENGTSILMLKTVSHQTQATYKCIAKNEVGQARKLFRVFVEDTRHSAWSTAFAVVIPILVIISVGIFGLLVWKMQLQRKVVDRLTRVVFRETRTP